MNKKEKEIEYQKGLTELYEETQDFGRIDFVKVLFDLKEELDIANKKIEEVKDIMQQMIDGVFEENGIQYLKNKAVTRRLNILLSIIGSD